MSRVLLRSGLLSLVACKGSIEPNGTNDGGPNNPGGPDGGPGGNLAAACGVQSVLAARCASCHGALPTAGATMPLRTLHDMRVSSAMDGTLSNSHRALIRMRDSVSPMPPAPHERASAVELTALETWIGEGMPLCNGTGGPPATVVSEPNLLDQSALFSRTEGVRSDAPTRIRRMNRREFTRNVGGSREMGGAPADGRVELTSLELGSQLAYALAGRAPSATPLGWARSSLESLERGA